MVTLSDALSGILTALQSLLAPITDWPIWSNAVAAAVATGLLAIANAWLSMAQPRWKRSSTRAIHDHKRLKANEAVYEGHPTSEIYTLANKLRLAGTSIPRDLGIAERATMVAAWPQQDREVALVVARQWLDSVGEFAWLTGKRRQVGLRDFLATNHLQVMRQGAVVLPLVAALLATGTTSPADARRARWATGLVQLAFRYNDVARQQREPVYISVGEQVIGLIAAPPARGRRFVLNRVDAWSRGFRLRPRHGRRLWRRLVSVSRGFRPVEVAAPHEPTKELGQASHEPVPGDAAASGTEAV